MSIVYRHRRLDTFEVFYIGIGKTEKRAYSKKNRNKWWKNIILKTEYSVDGLYHPGRIPGCEPSNSLPCNSGYWEYRVY